MLELANRLPDVAFLSILAQFIQRLEPLPGVKDAADRLLDIGSRIEQEPPPEEFRS
jgi:hypothetical protein